MMKKLIVAAALSAAAPAAAKDEVPCGKDLVCASAPATVGAGLMRAGYQGLIDKDKGGDPMVESAASGYKFTVYFYGCEKNVACDSLQFYAGFKNDSGRDLAFVNKWNAGKRFSQMSLDKDGDIEFRYDVTTMGGLTQKNFGDVVDWWATMLGELGKFFDANPGAEAKAPAKP
jgi:hypothetical protein